MINIWMNLDKDFMLINYHSNILMERIWNSLQTVLRNFMKMFQKFISLN